MDRPLSPLQPLPAGLVFLLAFSYFAAWAVLRPPLQTPDEPQHLMRTTSVLRQPWLGDGRHFPLDRAYLNPLAYDTPPPIDKLFFQPFNALTNDEIRDVRQTAWMREGAPLPDYERAIASYPTPFYLVLFAMAEPVTRVGALSPWDASYVYRFATAALAAALWACAWRVLRAIPALSPWRGPLFAFVVLNPMLAFMSSGVNPDAVNIPLCTLAVLFAWRLLTEGEGTTGFVLSLLGSMLTKPSGLQLGVTLTAVIAAMVLLRQLDRRHAVRVIGPMAACAVLAVVCFYAWSPPRFMAGGPSADSLTQYLARRWDQLPWMWRTYWGQLGWLDYAAPSGWYLLMLLAVVANVACVLWRPAVSTQLRLFLGLLWLVFAGLTFAGEYRYLAEAGYIFQGRYLLPAGIGLGVILLHRVAPARVVMLALIVLLNLALVHATVQRYFADDWAGVVAALPFRQP